MRIAIQAENLVGGANFQHAGVGRYSYSIIDNLLQIGQDHEWFLMATSEFSPPEEWTRRKNFHFKVIPRKLRLWRVLQRTPYLLRHRIDSLFVLTGPTCNHSLFKRFATIHDLFPFDHPEAFEANSIEPMKALATQQILKSDRLFAVSQNTKDRIIKRFSSRSPETIIVTPNGPGNVGIRRNYEDMSQQALEEFGVPFSRYLFTLGTLEPRKNLSRLIEAFAIACKNNPDSNFGLVVGGGKGWKESAIFEAASNLGIQDRVVFLGYVPDDQLPALFARSEAFVCASIDEGFGIPILEAMLYGTPVITSNRGALPEVGGDAVHYFDPENLEEIAEAIQMVANNQIDREKLISAGFERSKHFSWAETAQATLKVLVEKK